MSQQQQLDLFSIRNTNYGQRVDAKSLARRSDPVASKLAAEQVACGLTEIEAIAVEAARKRGRDFTALEIANAACPDNHARRETIRKRVGELASIKRTRFGNIRRTAWFKVVGQRKCEISGKVATTFEVIQ